MGAILLHKFAGLSSVHVMVYQVNGTDQIIVQSSQLGSRAGWHQDREEVSSGRRCPANSYLTLGKVGTVIFSFCMLIWCWVALERIVDNQSGKRVLCLQLSPHKTPTSAVLGSVTRPPCPISHKLSFWSLLRFIINNP